MRPRLRKLALTAHVTVSVGWFGTVAAFQALAIAALTSQELDAVRSLYLAMALTGRYVIIPFCLATLVSGLVVSLGTHWGLFRHYWVVLKFLITLVSALILLGFTQTLNALGELAADSTASFHDLRDLRQSPVLHAGGGLLAILTATLLAIYKPWGLTPYGLRKRTAGAGIDQGSTTGIPWKLYLMLGLTALVLVLLVLHLMSGGAARH